MTPPEGSASSTGMGSAAPGSGSDGPSEPGRESGALHSTIDEIDRATGLVTGHLVTAGHRSDVSTYSLDAPIDDALGTVTVDPATGRWSFSPHQKSRLAAFADVAQDFVEFTVRASQGSATRTVTVNAPVDAAEAAVTGSIDVGGGFIYGMAAVDDRLYVLNGSGALGDNGFVRIIDTATNTSIGFVEAGSTPFDLVANGDTLYVSNVNDAVVSVLDPGAGTVSTVIDVGADPLGLAVVGDRLYVANGAGTVSVIDLDTNTEITQVPTAGDPFGVVADGDRLYVTNYGGRTVSVIDLATNGVVDETVGGHPHFAAVFEGRLYVANSSTNTLTVVDGAASTVVDVHPATPVVDAIPAGAAPVDTVVCGDRVYVGNLADGTVVVLDGASQQIVETISPGIQPGLMAAGPDGRTIYVADVTGGTVRVITSVHDATPSAPAGALADSYPSTVVIADTATGTAPSAP